MTIEHKHLAMSLKALGEDGTIEGYGSVFGNIDSGKDIVLPGAFAKCLAKGAKPKMLWQHKTDMPIGVYDEVREDARGLYVKGRLLLDTDMGRNAYALLKAGAIDGLSIGYGVRDYAVDRKSGCRMLKELDLFEVSLVTFPMNQAATVTGVKSASGDIDTAVSLLTAAAAMCAAGEMSADACASCNQLITAAVALLDEPEDDTTSTEPTDPEEKARPATLRQFEKFLREAGHFSPKDATTVALRGFKALDQGEPDQEALDHLTRLFNQFTA